MAKFKPYIVDQIMLFPPSLRDFVPEGHLARLIDTVAEQLDTTTIENKYSNLGQNTYHPKILIKLLFYGYATGERSGRKISGKCETDTAYIYLGQMYKPDFRTINDFRKNNIVELADYFVDIVRICKSLGLITLGQINIDGTKMKANAANRRTKTNEEYQEWLKRIDTKIRDILKEAEDVDAAEDEAYGDKRGDELPEDINTYKKLKRKIEEVKSKLEGNKEKANLTDTDAKFMKNGNGRIDVGYNCQTAVTAEQIIVSSEVVTNPTDRKLLEIMIETSEKNLQEDIREIAADSGYSSYDNYEYLKRRKKTGYIPDQYSRRDQAQGIKSYHQDNFTYDTAADTYTCPEGKRLLLNKIRRKKYGYRHFHCRVYKCAESPTCGKRELCTKQKYRTIQREDRKELVDEMRNRLNTKEGYKKYVQRMWTTEPVFGHLKFNLGYKQFLLRTLEKVRGEFRLMCIGVNLKKMNKLLITR